MIYFHINVFPVIGIYRYLYQKIIPLTGREYHFYWKGNLVIANISIFTIIIGMLKTE